MSEHHFIEVNRVLSNNEKINISTKPETINIGEIQGFRAWHKGKKDVGIKGEMTIVMMKSAKQSESEADKGSFNILIEESYTEFSKRISKKIIITNLP